MFRSFYFYFLSLLIFTLFSCDVQSNTTVDSTASTQAARSENKIVYLFFEIEKAEDGAERLILTNTKISAGFLKNASIDNRPSISGNLLISFMGKKGEVLEERIIEDPLNPLLEVYAVEGLSKNKLKLDKAEFSVRFNQKGEIFSVKIEKILQNSKKTLVIQNL